MEQHSTYNSPSSWRYGIPEMRELWSEMGKRYAWREVWFALARAQSPELFPTEMLGPIMQHVGSIQMDRSLEVEQQVKHDLVAELRVFQEQAGESGRYIHLGATSSDIQENATALQVRQSLWYLLDLADKLESVLMLRAREWADVQSLGRTHLQPAEPVTQGFRVRLWLADLQEHIRELTRLRDSYRGKGFKGAVGTYSGYLAAYKARGYPEDQLSYRVLGMEERAMAYLGLDFYTYGTQIPSRYDELAVMNALSSLAAHMHKIHQDIRLLAMLGEVEEGFDTSKQVGSSAMPHKRNPIESENVCSLARMVPAMAGVAWENRAASMLERTLDDSANRRYYLPETMLICSEILSRSLRVFEGLRLREDATRKNVVRSGTPLFAPVIQQYAQSEGIPASVVRDVVQEAMAWADERSDSGTAAWGSRFLYQLQRDPRLAKIQKGIGQIVEEGLSSGLAPILARGILKDVRYMPPADDEKENGEE